MSKTLITAKAVGVSLLDDAARVEFMAVLSRFRAGFRHCVTARGDALFELCDAVVCTDGPVRPTPSSQARWANC